MFTPERIAERVPGCGWPSASEGRLSGGLRPAGWDGPEGTHNGKQPRRDAGLSERERDVSCDAFHFGPLGCSRL